jgi:hypothetical protein
VRPTVSGEKLVWNGSVCLLPLLRLCWREAVEAELERGVSAGEDTGCLPRKRLLPPEGAVGSSTGMRPPAEPIGRTLTLGPVLSSTVLTGMVGCGLGARPLLVLPKDGGVGEDPLNPEGVGEDPLKPGLDGEPKDGFWVEATTALKRSLSDTGVSLLPTRKDWLNALEV